MREVGDDVSRNRERCRIVAAVGNRRASMLNRSNAVLLMQSATDEAMMVAPTQKCISGTVIGLELHGVLEQRNRDLGVLRYHGKNERQRPQHKIIGIEVAGAL